MVVIAFWYLIVYLLKNIEGKSVEPFLHLCLIRILSQIDVTYFNQQSVELEFPPATLNQDCVINYKTY